MVGVFEAFSRDLANLLCHVLAEVDWVDCVGIDAGLVVDAVEVLLRGSRNQGLSELEAFESLELLSDGLGLALEVLGL